MRREDVADLRRRRLGEIHIERHRLAVVHPDVGIGKPTPVGRLRVAEALGIGECWPYILGRLGG
jgi:hypothetical protein